MAMGLRWKNKHNCDVFTVSRLANWPKQGNNFFNNMPCFLKYTNYWKLGDILPTNESLFESVISSSSLLLLRGSPKNLNHTHTKTDPWCDYSADISIGSRCTDTINRTEVMNYFPLPLGTLGRLLVYRQPCPCDLDAWRLTFLCNRPL